MSRRDVSSSFSSLLIAMPARVSATFLFVALLVSGCATRELIVGPDAAVADAGADSGWDAGLVWDGGGQVEPTAGGECDQQDDCLACRACSFAPQQTCNSLVLSCEEDDDCLALAQCVSACGDDVACLQGCGAAHPDSREPYLAAIRCELCDACPADCREYRSLWCSEAPF